MEDQYARVLQDLLERGCLQTAKHYQQVDSTNSVARRFLESACPRLPALFVADQQTQGRGRSNHVWWSPPGCLMMTLLIGSDNFPQRRECWSQLGLVVGAAVAQAIEHCCQGLDVQLKWPNDLYAEGKKFGGILIESISRGSDGTRAVPLAFAIGLGINVQIEWSEASIEIRNKATCLTSLTSKRIAVDQILGELISVVVQSISTWSQDRSAWYQDWFPRCLLSGKVVKLNTLKSTEGIQVITGVCEGINVDGQLLVRLENGVVQAVTAGEVLEWS